MQGKKKFRKTTAKNKLHSLWSEKVRQRDGYACQWCLSEGRRNVDIHNHAHHIVAQSLCGNSGRFEITNGVTLCYRCHMHRLKAEVDEYISFRDAWLGNVGIDYHDLRDRYRDINKFSEEFYLEKKRKLEVL